MRMEFLILPQDYFYFRVSTPGALMYLHQKFKIFCYYLHTFKERRLDSKTQNSSKEGIKLLRKITCTLNLNLKHLPNAFYNIQTRLGILYLVALKI